MNESQGLLSDPKAKTTELQNPNKMKESGLDVGAAHTQKKPNTEVNSMQGSKEMGLGSDSCKELEEVARGVNVSKEQKLTVNFIVFRILNNFSYNKIYFILLR